MASKKFLILRRPQSGRLEGRTRARSAKPKATSLAAIAGLALLCLPGITAAQVDCDRYAAGSAARNRCDQTEYWHSHDDLRRAHDQQQDVDRYTREQRYDARRDRDRADPWGQNDSLYRSGGSDDDDR